MTRSPLLVAEWLLASGAGASVRSVLGNLRGAAANRLRAASEGVTLQPGIYGLVALPEGGAALPLRPSLGVPRASDPAFREACRNALDCARSILGAPSLPSLRFEFEEWFAISGPSIGLPAVLAFIAHFAPHLRLESAILATGELGASNGILPVGGLVEKLAIASAELGRKDVIVPGEDVTTLASVLSRVFGERPLEADPALLRVDDVIHRARATHGWSQAAAVLEAVVTEGLPPADLARVWLERGTMLRHAGRTDEAMALHERARELLAHERLVVGAEAAERYELECWLSAMDAFELETVRPTLEDRLREPFLSLRNELRCRGMLAQVLGMSGSFSEAVLVRTANLPLHDRSEDLRAGRAGTLCPLALDAARAGDLAGFDGFATEAVRATHASDAQQARYSAAAVVRGLVALGRGREALAWAQNQSTFAGVRPFESLSTLWGSAESISTHPEVSTARALCRALRREGEPARAFALAQRVVAPPGDGVDLVAWLALLARLEGALAQFDLHDDAWRDVLSSTRSFMTARHPAATRFHHDLIGAETPDLLEAAIDRVWY